jgi:hypothetical protein
MPTISGILETILYASELDGVAEFYENVLGLRIVSDRRPLSLALRIARAQVSYSPCSFLTTI